MNTKKLLSWTTHRLSPDNVVIVCALTPPGAEPIYAMERVNPLNRDVEALWNAVYRTAETATRIHAIYENNHCAARRSVV